jgi:NAD(P)-dependent dehydrogenase (short-subunit alcohol dehydrogenase family)
MRKDAACNLACARQLGSNLEETFKGRAMKNIFDLSGQVVIITGSSRGIGRAAAEIMAAQGAQIVVSSRKAEACEEVAQAIHAQGGKADVIACNIGRKAEIENLVAETMRKFGRIDALVCNAAVNPYHGPMSGLSDEAFEKVMASNVKSNLWLANLAAPIMAQQGGGSITIVSSIAGIRGTGELGVYGISKAADFALARNLAVEWGPQNIRANCVAPGLVKTDFARALWENPEYLKKRTSTSPLRRIGEPHEIGGIVAFLASKAATFITGQVLVADGGVTIGS